MSTNKNNPVFMTTRWSIVISATKDDSTSLEDLCRQYWQPVYAVARTSGHDIEMAKDLTQSFFAKLLEKSWLKAADQNKGRFRTFLITTLKRYLANEWHKERALKREGSHEIIPLDEALTGSVSAAEARMGPDRLFDRRWALVVLDSAMTRLKDESYETFSALKETLTADRGEVDYQKIADSLQTSEGSARVAVHRFRKRYRALIRSEVAETVSKDEEIENELEILLEALF